VNICKRQLHIHPALQLRELPSIISLEPEMSNLNVRIDQGAGLSLSTL